MNNTEEVIKGNHSMLVKAIDILKRKQQQGLMSAGDNTLLEALIWLDDDTKRHDNDNQENVTNIQNMLQSATTLVFREDRSNV